ncbi:MAG TPA: hypothetical protein PLV92_28900, partial [Pirellulaceae bacterium]|nr:hypothetical protein [Pirellulaceae bacterium]
MASRNRPHIIVARQPSTDPYTSYVSGRDSPRPAAPIDRFGHGNALARAAEAAAVAGKSRRRQSGDLIGMAAASDGVYVVFESVPGFDLRLTTLDPQSPGDQPELVAVQRVVVADGTVERATVFVPDGKLGYFVKRFEEYARQDTRSGKPKHADFVERVATVRLASIEALWTDDPDDFPA